jgi:putative acetyltransferase
MRIRIRPETDADMADIFKVNAAAFPTEAEARLVFDELHLMGLAPMAVSPSLQRDGIGTELVNAGLQICRELGVGAVAVLGHPEYYPRFGFRPASQWGIKCEYDVPEEVFMLMELSPAYLQDYQGTIRYHAAFADI